MLEGQVGNKLPLLRDSFHSMFIHLFSHFLLAKDWLEMEVDPWDSLVDVEGRMYEDGYREGQEAAIADGIIEEGRRTGFMKGYAIALEVAFMQNIVKAVLEKDNKKGETEAEGEQGTASSRLHKRRTELIARCESLPTTNVNSIDFAEEVRQIRTIYKQCSTGVEFAPRKVQEAAPTQEW